MATEELGEPKSTGEYKTPTGYTDEVTHEQLVDEHNHPVSTGEYDMPDVAETTTEQVVDEQGWPKSTGEYKTPGPEPVYYDDAARERAEARAREEAKAAKPAAEAKTVRDRDVTTKVVKNPRGK